jgi:acetyltransferase-like isoleucine patch superfamily enzyme
VDYRAYETAGIGLGASWGVGVTRLKFFGRLAPGAITQRSTMGANYTDKPIDEFLFWLYGVNNRYSRKIIRELLLRRKNSEIYSRVLRKIFSQYHDVHIGMYSYGMFSCGLPPGTVIGRYTSGPKNLLVINGSHPTTHKSHHPFFFNPDLGYCDKLLIERRTKLVIGNDVYIGLNVTIMHSVTSIGDGAVIGAGSVVIKDIPPFAVAMGNPARILMFRFSPETIEKITASRWWDKDIDELRADEQEFDTFQKPME